MRRGDKAEDVIGSGILGILAILVQGEQMSISNGVRCWYRKMHYSKLIPKSHQ